MYFYIIFILWFCVINCQKDFFVVKTYVTDPINCKFYKTRCNVNETISNYYCITNSSFAISWINGNTESVREASKFIPQLSETNPFENMTTPENWTIDNSIHGVINDLILDWRWEYLETHSIPIVGPPHYVPKSNLENNFTISLSILTEEAHIDRRWKNLKALNTSVVEDYVVFSNLGNNFTIPLSILSEEAHILLCDTSDVSKASCYSILMQAFGGTNTTFAKCSSNYHPIKGIDHSCNKILKTINHPQDVPLYMSKDKWSHFIIEKSNNRITLSQANESNFTEIISYVDNDIVIDVKHMVIIGSDLSECLWKIHNSTYMFTRQQTNRVRFGSVINTIEDSVCISMFTSMCSTCSIRLSLAKGDNPSLILYEELVDAKRGWAETKFIKNNITEHKVIMLVSTIDSSNHDSFWAIDGVRQCQKRESRYISTNQSAKCQLISDTENIISTDDKTQVYNENNCPEHTLSSYCVPCKWFLGGDCGRAKIYENYKTITKYSCSTGHRGTDCDTPCYDGVYGQGCRKECGKCKNNICNKFDGTCETCQKDYSGRKCEIPPPRTVGNITLTYLSTSNIQVEWKKPLFYQNHNINNLLYTIEYQHNSYIACKQNPSDNTKWKIKKIVYDQNVTLTNLLPYSSYIIWISAKYGQDEGQPEKKEFQTKFSEKLQEHEILEIKDIIPKSHTAEIIFSDLDCQSVSGPLLIRLKATCSNKWCINNVSRSDFVYNKNVSKILTDLLPFSNYTLEIRYCRNDLICSDTVKTQNFVTKSRAPGVVIDPEVYSKNESSAFLRLIPPYPPKGILEIYIIEYFCENNEKSKSFTITQCPLWPNFQCVTLTELEKSKNYTIKIMAKNKEVSGIGPIKTINVYTRTESSDAPYDIKMHWTLENHLELEWKHPNHTNGDISKFNITAIPHLKANTEHNIYKELLIKEYRLIYHYKIDATNFLPSTEYKILISAFNGNEGKQQIEKDRSPPSIPSLDDRPKIITLTNITITLEMLTKQIRSQKISNEYKLFILGYDNNTNIQSHPELKRFEKDFQMSLPKFKMLYECQVREFNNSRFTIGSNEDIKGCVRISNYSLKPKIEFNISVLLTNNDGNKSRYRIYYVSDKDTTTYLALLEPKDHSLLGLLALLLIIPIIIIIYTKRKPIVEQYNSYKKYFHRNNRFNTRDVPEEISLINIPTDAKETEIYSKPIKVNEFENYVKNTISNGELERQHALFPRGQTKPWECGAKITNKSKNRYVNLMAYDHTRVVLQKIDGKEDSDYINANYIDGYKIPRAYIATQGPKKNTTHDFWRMIWENNVQHIAMLANVIEGGKKKVEQYWPGINDTLFYHDITIQFVSNQVFSDYEYRVFNVTKNNHVRKVHQYHFFSWPDHGVPLYSQSLVPFLQRLLQIPLSSNSPIVVHCSAGVGRTGTILLCDISLRMAWQEGEMDILRNLQKLRDQRPNMVDNSHQYKLAHLVILECLCEMKTGISCSDIENEVERLLSNNKISIQMRYLEDVAWQDQIMKDVSPQKILDIVEEKNRFYDIIPEAQGCIYLPRYPTHDDKSTYINAVTVDGFQNSGRFIVTQQPMPNTLGDFWRLVAEKNSSVIVSLNEIDLKNQTSCEFWPTEKNRQVIPVDYITLEHASTLNLECYDLTTVHMHLNGEQEYAIIEIISMKNWPSNTNCPKKLEDFLTFWEDANTTSRKSNPVIVTCFDGVKASGLYVAMTFLIEKINLEQICDVCQAVRNVRHNRCQFVRNEEQFAFLYKAAVSYINNFKTYANFN